MCILPQILESHDALCQPGKHRHSSPEGEHLPFPLQKFRCAHGCRGTGVVVVAAALAVVAMAVVVVAFPKLGAAVVAFAKIAVESVVIAVVVVDVVALAVLDDAAVDVDVRRAGYTHWGQK